MPRGTVTAPWQNRSPWSCHERRWWVMELPECPVCLQYYDGNHTIPRVLSCGHTVCEACLVNLPQKFPLTIRCPACTILVKFPLQGPSALPKNIDLLRLIPSSPEKNPQKLHGAPQSYQQVDFIPRSWSDEFYSAWKDWILPNDAVSLEAKSNEGSGRVGEGEEDYDCDSLLLRGSLRKKEKVSLLPVGSSLSDNDTVFKLSYDARIMDCLSGMEEEKRDELGLVSRVSVKQSRTCKVLGLWGDTENRFLYLVSERKNGCLLDEFGDLSGNGLSSFSLVSMEICEAVISLHKEGLIAGCLGFSCLKFDDFGHVYLDLNEVLEMGRQVCRGVVEAGSGYQRIGWAEMSVLLSDLLNSQVFVSPEVLLELLQREGIEVEGHSFNYSVGYSSDVWSLSCVLLRLLLGKQFTDELVGCIRPVCAKANEVNGLDSMCFCMTFIEKVGFPLESKFGMKFESLQQILCRSLHLDLNNRPLITDIWKSVRELIISPQSEGMVRLNDAICGENRGHCLVLGELCLCRLPRERAERPETDELQGTEDDCGTDFNPIGEAGIDKDLVEGLSNGSVKSKDMQGHIDCVTALAVGGSFLFSSSFDKSIHVWSLQDFTHLHTFKGHAHKVMAVVYVDGEQQLCISGDSEGGIFVWSACVPLGQEPLRKWYEPKDWRYSGIHALTVSGNGYLYTGSGDKTIKAWLLQDGTLAFTMTGHKSVVSTLVVCSGVLYSGSWDGTIRLWSLSDHSLLTVLGEDTPGGMASVLSLTVDEHTLVAAHENGSLKVWRNDVFVKSIQTHHGAIFTVGMEGKWLFSGGWDKTVNVQELTGDEFQLNAEPIGSIPCGSVITALLYWQGKLFVGYGDRTIRVYYYEK